MPKLPVDRAQILEIELTTPCPPRTTLRHSISDGRFARISHKEHPEDSRWYGRVLREGPVAPGDQVEVASAVV